MKTIFLTRAKTGKDFMKLVGFQPKKTIINTCNNLDNDIALLELGEKVDLGTYTPVCLPKKGIDYTQINGYNYAYGKEGRLCIIIYSHTKALNEDMT